MRYLPTALLCIVLYTWPDNVSAQAQFTGWVGSYSTFHLTKKLGIYTGLLLKSSDQLKNVQGLSMKTGLSYFHKHYTITAGYAYLSNRRIINSVSGFVPEHRVWEQFLFRYNAGPVMWTQRVRLEQRFLAKPYVYNNSIKSDGNAFADRLSYLVKGMVPIIRTHKFTRGPFIALQDELCMTLGDRSPVNGKFIDQNKAYAALGYRFQTAVDGEIGYMNKYQPGPGRNFNNYHIIQIVTYVHL